MDSTTTEPAGGFDGKVEGGGAYVAAAYSLSLSLLLAYTLVVSLKLRRGSRAPE